MRVIKLFFSLCLFLCLSQAEAKSDLQSEQEILAGINHYRAEQGLSPLKALASLKEEAVLHSQAMADKKVAFGHAGFSQRSSRVFKHFKSAKGLAENVAFNFKDPSRVVAQWINSPGHRQNIEGNYNLTGIGMAWDKDGRVYVTQIFLRA